MIKAIIERLQKDENFSAKFTQGLSTLIQSGLFDVLREQAKVRQVNAKNGALLHELAAEAQRSYGYNQCLDDLFYFREKFLQSGESLVPQIGYGSLSRAKESGDLEPEEIDAIRSGNTHALKAKTVTGRANAPASA